MTFGTVAIYRVVLVSLLCLASARGAEPSHLGLDQLLPQGILQIDFVDVRPTDAVAAITDKLSGQVDRGWFQQYVADAKPGQPLAYHPKMGVSREEYKAMLDGLAGMSLMPVGVQMNLRITKEEEVFTFEPIGKKSDTIQSLRIHSSTLEARMGGESLGVGQWAESQQQSVVGPWRGYKWSLEEGNPLAVAFGGDFQVRKARFTHLIGTDWVLVDLEYKQRVKGKNSAFHTMFRYEVPGIDRINVRGE